MKQDQIDLISQALDEAYRALQQGDKDIAMNCIVYIQTIINQKSDSVSELQTLISEIARLALDSGSLSLGDYTLQELISNELDVTGEELGEVASYLNTSLSPTEEHQVSSNPYTERGLEDRTKPIRALPTFEGWTDEQIANYTESN